MHKAAREAKLRTAWTRPDAGYEDALRRFVELTLDAAQPAAWWADLQAFASRIALFGAWNSLSLTLLKFASPGVPDVYQGTELMPLTLVDPDNRRAVDYACREDLLEDFERRAAGARSAESVDAFARARRTTAAPSSGSPGGCWRCAARRTRSSAMPATAGCASKDRSRGTWSRSSGATRDARWWW